jgi:hypothetical protein
MQSLKQLAICALLLGSDTAPGKDLAEDPFLRPYVEQLKKSTPADDLGRITAMNTTELILLHHGYGTYIRNRWIHGDRDPALVKFFLAHKINHPDEMSVMIIEALWRDLNSRLGPEQRASVEKKRAVVARKRKAYEKLESECEVQLTKARSEFGRHYASHGRPSDSALRGPFLKLLVEKSGHVRKIFFLEGDSPELKAGLAKVINGFIFSSFSDDEFVTLDMINFPHCRVAERDTLHDR